MDSVSQLVLGASVGHAVLGHRMGRKALFVGAALGTLPDLDVLVHYADAVDSFTYHRSYSHSVFVLTLLSFPLAWGLKKLLSGVGAQTISPQLWWLATWLCLVTHPILDGFTIYGTQIFWPLAVPPVAIGSIFIIDPAYTLPLIVGVALCLRRTRQYGVRLTQIALVLSSLYLGLTLVLQQQARQMALANLSAFDVLPESAQLLVAPTPLSLMWRYVVVDNDRYLEGYRSVFDKTDQVVFHEYDRELALLDLQSEIPAIGRLRWFTEDFVAAEEENGILRVNDLRMGVEASYVFSFRVADKLDGQYVAVVSELLPFKPDVERMSLIWKRLFDQSVDVQLRR